MLETDPRGFYRILGIAANASSQEIKAAYKKKALELHPDRNSSPSALEGFKLVKEAYENLIDPELRGKYDTSGFTKSNRHSFTVNTAVEPVMCQNCQVVSAQPRYVVFFKTVSFLFYSKITPIQGVFCSDCARNKSIASTAITVLLGWWAFPWGLIYSMKSIGNNIIGGIKAVSSECSSNHPTSDSFQCSGKT
ncbi:MAG: J domain-containing protein [Enterobacterales bacterium]|nr:J domain-containing protein [Enterobacterales bacterium]